MSFHKLSSKIKLIHLLSEINQPREQASIRSLQQLKVEYIQMINPRFMGNFPMDNCFTPNHPSISSGTWGCFQAHKKAVCEGFSNDFDYLLVCECDCYVTVSPQRFIEAVNVWGRKMVETNMWALFIGGFSGFRKAGKGVYRNDFFFSQQSVDAHCVLYPMKTLSNIVRLFETEKWWPFDLWLSRLLKEKLAITKAKFASQIEGKSLIDGEVKGIDSRRLRLV